MAGAFELDVQYLSLPTRGAWIETIACSGAAGFGSVAPHTGSVD